MLCLLINIVMFIMLYDNIISVINVFINSYTVIMVFLESVSNFTLETGAEEQNWI